MALITADLQALIDHPAESLAVEIKNWLNLADRSAACSLAKAAIALANTGGGYIVLGFDEMLDGTFVTASREPQTLEGYSQDTVARIVATYADPAFQVTVTHVPSRFGGHTHPVVSVPGGHRVPILAKRGSPDQKTLMVGHVYVRRPLPESAEPATATEWRELLDRCIRAGRDDLLDAIRGVLEPREPEETSLSSTAKLREWRDDAMARWLALRNGGSR